MRMPAAAVLALALAAAAPAAVAQEKAPAAETRSPHEEAYFKGFYLESGLRDFAKAAEAYASAAEAAAAAGDKSLQAKALLGRGRCLRILERADEAKAAFEAVLQIDPANDEAAALLVTPPGEREQQVRDRIDHLIGNGLVGGDRQEAARELRLLVPRCFPSLEAALRETRLVVVEAAATFLASVGSAPAREILLRALRDPEVVYGTAIARCACLPRNGGSLDDSIRGFTSSEIPLLTEIARFGDREVLVEAANRLSQFTDGRLPEEGVRVLLRLLEAPDPQVRRIVLERGWSPAVMQGLAPGIRRNLDDADEGVRLLALAAAQGDAGLARSLDDAIRTRLEDASPEVRRAAFAAARPRLKEAELARLLGGDDPHLSASAAKALQDLAPWSADTQKAAREAVARAMKGDLPPEQASTVMGLAFAVPGGSLRTADLVDLYVESAPAAHLGQYRRQLVERIVMMTRVRGGGPGPELWSVAESGAARLLDQPGALAQWLGFFGTTGFQFPGAWAVAARAKGPEARRLAYEGICAVAGTDAAVREAALPFLGEDLRSPDLEMQKLAVRVAGALPAPGHAESLRALRSTAREEERSRILEVLVACAGMGALQEVREDLASTDEALRRTALRMLVNELRVRDPAELVGYVDRGGDPYHIVELAEYDHPPEAAFLRPFILALPPEKYTEDFIYGAAAILEGAERVRLLETAMSSRDPEVVERAVERAGELRVLGLWPRLLGMMEEGNGGVREAAERALQNLQKYAETKASLARFGKDDQAAAIRDAERLLQSNDPAKRRGAALALGALGDRGAIAALLRLLDDKEAAVRDAALGALERLGGGKAEAPK